MVGKSLAAMMLRGEPVAAEPLSRSDFRTIPPHAMYPLGIRLYTAYYRWLDAREQAR